MVALMPLILREERLVKCTKEVDGSIETLPLKLGGLHKQIAGRYWVIAGVPDKLRGT
jgi:hypothetical protein